MEIVFRLAWLKQGAPARRAFRLPGSAAWLAEYITRLTPFAPCRVAGGLPPRQPGTRIWLCHRNAPSLASEHVAEKLQEARDGGVRTLEVAVGDPDGFAPQTIRELKPELVWSFGPLTLPHELAAVVAAEQVYRAWTILSRSPYHLGH